MICRLERLTMVGLAFLFASITYPSSAYMIMPECYVKDGEKEVRDLSRDDLEKLSEQSLIYSRDLLWKYEGEVSSSRDKCRMTVTALYPPMESSDGVCRVAGQTYYWNPSSTKENPEPSCEILGGGTCKIESREYVVADFEAAKNCSVDLNPDTLIALEDDMLEETIQAAVRLGKKVEALLRDPSIPHHFHVRSGDDKYFLEELLSGQSALTNMYLFSVGVGQPSGLRSAPEGSKYQTWPSTYVFGFCQRYSYAEHYGCFKLYARESEKGIKLWSARGEEVLRPPKVIWGEVPLVPVLP